MKKLGIIALCLLSAGCASQMSGGDIPAEKLDPQYTQGSSDQLFATGERYAKGIGVSRNYAEAAKYYRGAAQMGNPKAEYALGYMYRTGHGVPHDYNLAAKWFERAAAQGNSDAEYSLGVRYML